MVGDAPLRKIVGADALAAIAAADQRSCASTPPSAAARAARGRGAATRAPPSPARDCGAASGRPGTRRRARSGRCVMRTAESVLLTCWPPAPDARNVSMRMSAGLIVDVGDRIGFRHHGDRARRRVDAPLRLGLRHALHAMAARLELELRIRALPDDAQRSLPCSRRARPAIPRRSRPASGCARRSACTSGRGSPAKSADSSPPVPARISRKTLRSSFGSFGSSMRCRSAASAVILRGRRRALLLGERLHLRIARHLVGGRDVVLGARRTRGSARRRARSRRAPRERAIAVEVARRVLGGERRVELVEAQRERFELGAQRGFHRRMSSRCRDGGALRDAGTRRLAANVAGRPRRRDGGDVARR